MIDTVFTAYTLLLLSSWISLRIGKEDVPKWFRIFTTVNTGVFVMYLVMRVLNVLGGIQ